jgi:hypothetical protein
VERSGDFGGKIRPLNISRLSESPTINRIVIALVTQKVAAKYITTNTHEYSKQICCLQMYYYIYKPSVLFETKAKYNVITFLAEHNMTFLQNNNLNFHI